MNFNGVQLNDPIPENTSLNFVSKLKMMNCTIKTQQKESNDILSIESVNEVFNSM